MGHDGTNDAEEVRLIVGDAVPPPLEARDLRTSRPRVKQGPTLDQMTFCMFLQALQKRPANPRPAPPLSQGRAGETFHLQHILAWLPPAKRPKSVEAASPDNNS